MCACPRSFSQLITPFIASESLGIPHTPLFCLLYQIIIQYDPFFLFLALVLLPQQKTLSTFYYFLSQYVNELCYALSFTL
jgi:hypothetical protein